MVNRTYADMARHYGTAIVAGREQARRHGVPLYRGFFPKSGRPCE
jgi:hypothetical protein